MWIDSWDPDGMRLIQEEIQSRWPQPTSRKGRVSELTQVFTLVPEPRAWVRFNALGNWGGTGLGRYREELISTAVSAAAQCKY